MVWADDNKTIFYSTVDQAKRPYRILRHVLGSQKDELVYEDLDEHYYVSVGGTRDNKYILVQSGATTTSEVSYIPSDRPAEKPTVILPREADHRILCRSSRRLFYILTNKNAKNFRLVQAPVKSPQPEHWKEVIPYNKDVMLEDVDLFQNYCVISEREGGLEYLDILDLRNGQSHRIEAPEPVYSIYMQTNAEFKTDVLRFGYESLVSPASVYDYDMNTRKRTLLKQRKVPGYDPSQYTSGRFFATASDGAKVPVSVVYKKGVPWTARLRSCWKIRSIRCALFRWFQFGTAGSPGSRNDLWNRANSRRR